MYQRLEQLNELIRDDMPDNEAVVIFREMVLEYGAIVRDLTAQLIERKEEEILTTLN